MIQVIHTCKPCLFFLVEKKLNYLFIHGGTFAWASKNIVEGAIYFLVSSRVTLIRMYMVVLPVKISTLDYGFGWW